METEESSERKITPTSRALKYGLAAGMLGIAAGVVIGVLRLESISQVFSVAGFHPWMIATFALGGIGVGMAVFDVIQPNSEIRSDTARVFVVGIGAIATPFVFTLIIAALILVVIMMAVSESS